MPRAALHGLTAIAYIGLGLAAVGAARRDPGAGHAWLAATLFSLPGLVLALVITGVDAVAFTG